MATLGSKKKPAVVRVKTSKRAKEIMKICNDNNWKVIVGIEPDKSEDISDLNKLLSSKTKRKERKEEKIRKVGRNDPCPCGSGKKYKKCCGRV